jgi:hypothetical protein
VFWQAPETTRNESAPLAQREWIRRNRYELSSVTRHSARDTRYSYFHPPIVFWTATVE